MRRRTFLAAATVGGFLPGCVSEGTDGPPTGNGSDDAGPPGEPLDRRYEECSREVIPYEQFPRDVQTEIGLALDGGYTADQVFLREAMDTDASYVSLDGEYYDPSVEEGGEGETLTLEVVRPKALPRPRSISVEHRLEGERAITLEVAAEDGTVLIDSTRSIRPGAPVEFGETARVGDHRVRATVEEPEPIETELTGTWRIDESRFEAIVVVGPEGLSVTGTVADLDVCRYER